MLADVKQATIAPLIRQTIDKGTTIYTDEYKIYDRLTDWGYTHRTVCHAAGEFARDEDGDGFCEVHVNTMEGFWSLLRSWLRRTGGSRRRNCRSTWGSSSSSITSADAAMRCSGP